MTVLLHVWKASHLRMIEVWKTEFQVVRVWGFNFLLFDF